MSEHESLIRSWADGKITAEELRDLESRLRDDPAVRDAFLSEMNIHTALDDLALIESASEASSTAGASRTDLMKPSSPLIPNARSLPRLIALAAAVAVMVGWGMFIVMSNRVTSPGIARIAGLGGPLMWTGDGGRILKDLTVGSNLSGGTIEGMVPDSWFELEFNDGSTVTISGLSMLTFSDYGQKELHLRKGTFSASVVPQPAGRPMLIHTRTALLEVLGTRFDVEAGLSATLLNVSEGQVRVKRLSDGTTVDVPSRHRVVAAADRELSPAALPDARKDWKSRLNHGPEQSYGRWSPATAEHDAVLKAIPYTSREGVTVNAAGFRVSTAGTAPVVLHPAAALRVRGRIMDAHEIYFGVTARHSNGEFAGRFHTQRSDTQLNVGEEFTVVLPLSEFRLDPSSVPTRLRRLKHATENRRRFPARPDNLTVGAVWLHSLFASAGLEVTEMELLSNAASAESQDD